MARDIYDISGRWLRVISRDFFGPCVRSPNGRFTLAWRNASIDPASGRLTRPGRFLLVDGGKVLIQGEVRKVMSACVSDEGILLVACGPREPGNLESTIYVFGPDGHELIKHRVKAGLASSGISADGTVAVCQAGNNPQDPADSGMLHFFDLEARLLVWKKRPETGWAAWYRFDTANCVLAASRGSQEYRYGFDGRCLDVERWGTGEAAARGQWLREHGDAFELAQGAGNTNGHVQGS